MVTFIRTTAYQMSELQQNEHGVAQYPKGHAGRLLVVLAAIQNLERPTAQTVADYTGLFKGNIDSYVQRIRDELGARLRKEGAVYKLEDLGPVVKMAGLKKALDGTIKQNHNDCNQTEA